jgi:hypothetical protein
LHLFRKIAGNPSGPGAEFGEISSIAQMMSAGENICHIFYGSFCMLKSSFEFMASLSGLLKTEEYCSLRIFAISLLSEMKLSFKSLSGPIVHLTLLNFFTYVKNTWGYV